MNDNISSIISPLQWIGKKAFIIGGGPSLSNFDFTPLQNQLTVGINKAFQVFPTTINYSMDEKFLKMCYHTHQWKQFSGIRASLQLGSGKYHCGFVYYVTKIKEKTLSFDITKGIYSGNNSGFGGMMLAICLGANPVYLLGMDMKIENNKTHWHEGYIHQTLTAVQRSCERFKRCFEEFAPVLQKQGIEVYNLNPNSGLTCFPFKSIEEVLK